MTPAIVVGCHAMGLGVIRSLGRRGVPVIAVHFESHEIAQWSRYVQNRIRVPHPENQQAGFVDGMMDVGRRYPGSLIIPTDDASLVAVSKHREVLEESFDVAAGDWAGTELFIEKRLTYDRAKQAGVAVPDTWVPFSEAEASRFADEAEYPLLVKPSQGHLFKAAFGRKMIEVANRNDLMTAYRRAADLGLQVMFQEIIPGSDANGANYNVFAISGEPVVEFTARQVRNYPARFGSPRVAVTEAMPQVIEPGRSTIRALGFDGFACIEFKIDDRNDSPVLMEVNGRHNLSSALAVSAGVDFPWIHYDYVVNGIKPDSSVEFRKGLYWIDLARDLAGLVVHRTEERLGLGDVLRPYRSPHVFAVASLADPLPMLARVWDAAVRLPGVLVGRGLGHRRKREA